MDNLIAQDADLIDAQPTQSDNNFRNLPLSESFERVAKVAEERAAFNEQMPKPDPLVEAMADCGVDRFESWADQFRAALEARGLEIRSKNDE
jgi:hypothetical protein